MIGDIEAHAGDVVAHPQQFRGVLHRDQRDAPVVLVHAHGQDAGRLERRACAACTPTGVTSPSGTDQHDPVADAGAQSLRERRAEDDAVAPRLEVGEPAGEQARCEIRDAALRIGHDAAHQHARGFALAGHHRLALDVRRGGHDARVMRELVELGPPIRDAPLESRDGRVRGETQDPRLELRLEAVHHRQDDDEHGDAHGQP